MKVLLGVGGGEDGHRALAHALEEARAGRYEVTIAVFDTPDNDVDPGDLERQVRAQLEESEATAPVRRLDDDPGAELIRVAETEEFDAIVIGGGRYSPMGKITLGSVAEFVVLNAQVTVILVR